MLAVKLAELRFVLHHEGEAHAIAADELRGVREAIDAAEAGKQARLVATTSIVRNHPLHVPDVISLANGNV